MRFVQVSDVHLGSRPGPSLRLPPAACVAWQREVTSAFRSCATLARDESAAAVLLPGDLFDHEGVTADTLAEAADILASCPCPVVIAPGNHDYDSPSSYYDPSILGGRHHLAWPPNVHIFRGGAWDRVAFSSVPGAAFTGLAFTHHTSTDDRPFSRIPPPQTGICNVLVFHGSRLGHQPPGKQTVLPFGDDDLGRAGYQYAAIGHYHSHSIMHDTSGSVRGAYAGCLAGRDLGECGAKGALVVDVDQGRAELRFVELDARRIHDIGIDCTGLDHHAEVFRRILRGLKQAGCRPRDIAYLRLSGRHGRGLDLRFLDLATQLEGRCSHAQVDQSALVPDYDVDAYRDGGIAALTTEGRFVRAMEQKLALASDDHERAALHRAMYYGLDALLTGAVTPRYELGEPL